MKELLRQRALDLGFDACRVCAAATPASGETYQQWIEAGFHGEMDYLRRQTPKRLAPQAVLPGVKSILVLATNYYVSPSTAACQRPPGDDPEVSPIEIPSSPHPHPSCAAPDPPRGIVARYAQYRDYHQFLAPQLKSLSAYVDHLGGPGTRSLAYTDTGPILEREFAQRAGLGFIGKHTNLISRQQGNWIFLSEILTTLEIEPDAPESNRCGSCSRCLDACPTRAIVAPFKLDARKCISYLTIELKGPIPLELRPLIGQRIFGCDDCLAACPWNRFAASSRHLRSIQRRDLHLPDLIELLRLDKDGFRARFRDTPMQRSKRRGLLRNVCVALGNSADPRALPALEQARQDPEPLIAEHAAWAIDRLAVRPGFEPGLKAPKASVLPLHHRTTFK